jgi:hypothetical protein
VALVAMGLWLIDNANLEELAEACAAGAMGIPAGDRAPAAPNTTGSPVNPIAMV